MIEVFVPEKKAKTGFKREHQLTIGKAGRAMLTTEGKKLLVLEVGDGILQGKEGNELFIAKRPIGITNGYATSDIKGSLAFGGKTLLQIYPAGRYKLVSPQSGTVGGEAVTWYKLEVVPVKEKATA